MSENTMIVKIGSVEYFDLLDIQAALEDRFDASFTVTEITSDHISRREVERALDEVECVAQKPGEFSGREMFKRGATDAVIGVRNRLFSDASKPEAEEIIKHMASKEELALGAWVSAALEDPTTCSEMRVAVNNWFDTLILPETTEAEAIDSLRRGSGVIIENKNLPLYVEALALWGETAQLDMAVEECVELIAVIQHFKRDRVSVYEVIEEIADVSIMLEQLALMTIPAEVDKVKRSKILRLGKRILIQKAENESNTEGTDE